MRPGTAPRCPAAPLCLRVPGGTRWWRLLGMRGPVTVFVAGLDALMMASLDDGMRPINVESYLQDIMKDVILVAAVARDMVGKRPRPVRPFGGNSGGRGGRSESVAEFR